MRSKLSHRSSVTLIASSVHLENVSATTIYAHLVASVEMVSSNVQTTAVLFQSKTVWLAALSPPLVSTPASMAL